MQTCQMKPYNIDYENDNETTKHSSWKCYGRKVNIAHENAMEETKHSCKLLFKINPQTNTTTAIIGSGWKAFCLSNRIRPDSSLDFKCDSIMAKNIIFVI